MVPYRVTRCKVKIVNIAAWILTEKDGYMIMLEVQRQRKQAAKALELQALKP